MRQRNPALSAHIRRRWRPAHPLACLAQIAAAAAELSPGAPSGPVGDDALALLDQQRRELEQGRQAALPLEVAQ